jgi:hypothetical protein
MPKYLVEFTAYDEEEIVDRADCKRMANNIESDKLSDCRRMSNSGDDVVVEVSMATSRAGAAERILRRYGGFMDLEQLVAIEKEGEAGNPTFYCYDPSTDSLIEDEEW